MIDMPPFDIGPSLPDHAAQIEQLYRETFPDEDLMPLLQDLLSLGAQCLSLVGMAGDAIVGHVAFTRCAVEGCPAAAVALLGPLAVAPAEQRRGLGGALVREGLTQLTGEGIGRVLVLGDPNYYGRFGFRTETEVMPPYPIPEAWRTAWQSLIVGNLQAIYKGRLLVPAPWQRPELWGP